MSTTLSIKLNLPVAWSAAAPDSHVDGVLLLRVLALLEAAPPHLDDEDGPDALRWQALEARVDLMLQLIGMLLAKDAPLPPPCSLELSGEGARWLSPVDVPVGQHGTVSLRLSPRIPQSLPLPAAVTACEAQPDGRWLIAAHFQGLDAELQDWLEKTIFRRHRREVFERKHPHDD